MQRSKDGGGILGNMLANPLTVGTESLRMKAGKWIVGLLVWLWIVVNVAAGPRNHAREIASLVSPAKLATLGKRGANPRVQKAVYLLAIARDEGEKPIDVIQDALTHAGYTNAGFAALTKAALLRNLDIADKLGCLNHAGLHEMRRGRAPTVMRGPYKGDQLSVDHIIPRSVTSELDNVIANLELMPLRMNKGKSAKIGARQVALARELFDAGGLSKAGLKAVESIRLNERVNPVSR